MVFKTDVNVEDNDGKVRDRKSFPATVSITMKMTG
jgi:hypothetical protein